MHPRFSFALALALGAVVTGCGGGGGVNIAPQPAPPTAIPTAGGNATLQVALTVASTSTRVQGADVYVMPAGGTPAQRTLVGSFDVTPNSKRCTPAGAGRQCVLTMPVPAANETVHVELWDTVATGASSTLRSVARAGNRLGSTEEAQAVSAGATATMNVISDATPVSLTMQVTPTALPSPGSPIVVSLTALDAAGNAIANDYPVAMFAPPGAVSVSGTAPPSAVPIFSPGGATVLTNGSATFTYNGGAVNPLTTAAIAGTQSATSVIALSQPVSCTLASTPALRINQATSPLNYGQSGGFHVGVQFAGGKTQQLAIDTGSTGVLISQALWAQDIAGVSPAQYVGPGLAGQETLDPSGTVVNGNYYLVRLTIVDPVSGNALGQTVPMEVLVVSSGSAYMGIGFGRPSPAPGDSYLKGPAENAALQLTQIVQGSMHAGYVLSANNAMYAGQTYPGHMYFGLNAADTANLPAPSGWGSLTPFAGRPGDWNGPNGCITYNNDPSTQQCGQMVFDVGIDSMFLNDTVIPATPPPGSKTKINSIAITAPASAAPGTQLSYAFAYPVPSTATPPAPNPNSSTSPVQFTTSGTSFNINTGRDPLAVVDYAFDSQCGAVAWGPPAP